MRIETEADLVVLRAAADLLYSCEDLGDELESGNYHHLLDTLKEEVHFLHLHKWDGKRHDYDYGYEIECSVDGCARAKFVETP